MVFKISQLNVSLSDLTSRAIILYCILIMVCSVYFGNYSLPLIWIIIGATSVLTFFYFSKQLSIKWTEISEDSFKKKLFISAFIIRVIYVFFSYYFYISMTGQPFEYEAADSMIYHNNAMDLAYNIVNGKFNIFDSLLSGEVSDNGFPLYLGMLYAICGDSIIVARIINALISAWMCILIYKIARRNFDEAAARISAIMAMLLPSFIYYTGLHLKESIMVFLCVAFVERTDHLLKTDGVYFLNALTVLLLLSSLFFFRNVLGAVAIFALLSALAFSKLTQLNFPKRIVVAIWLIMFLSLTSTAIIKNETINTWKVRATNLRDQMENFATMDQGNKLATYGKSTIFLPLIFFAPLPTMVDTWQENLFMLNGALFTRNVFAFFGLMAIILIIRRRQHRQYVLLLTFLVSYLMILANSGFALSERFHMPALPFIIIFAGSGITQMQDNYKKYYSRYLFILGIVTIAWNWFKLAGRDLI